MLKYIIKFLQPNKNDNDKHNPHTVTNTTPTLTFWRQNYFLILAPPVHKMWITQEPNMLDLWNKLHFEEEKTESIYNT